MFHIASSNTFHAVVSKDSFGTFSFQLPSEEVKYLIQIWANAYLVAIATS